MAVAVAPAGARPGDRRATPEPLYAVVTPRSDERGSFPLNALPRLLGRDFPHPFYRLDSAGRIAELNRAGERLLGRSRRDVAGMHFREFLARGEAPAAEQVFARMMSMRAKPLRGPLRIVGAGGEPRDLVVTVAPVAEGGRRGLIGFARDVSLEGERRRVERLAGLASQIGGVAHKLNNPLTAIKGFAQLLTLGDLPADTRQALDVVNREADRAARIITDLRLMARHALETEHPAGGVNLNDVVRHVIRLRRYALASTSVAWMEDLSESIERVAGGRTELEQAVLAHMFNAERDLESVVGNGLLRVRTRAAGPRVVLETSGIPPCEAMPTRARHFDAVSTDAAEWDGAELERALRADAVGGDEQDPRG